MIATDLDVKKLKGLKGATIAKLDARSTADVNALVKEMSKKLGPIDVLVNAAGYVHHSTVLTSTDQEWDFAFDLNVRSMDRTIRAALPGMLKKKQGLDHQHRVGRLVGARHSVPLRLRHDQGRGDRAHQVGRGRFHQARASA